MAAKKELEFFGHIMRKGGLECLAVTGKIPGEQRGGRPRVGFVKGLGSGMGVSSETILKSSGGRELWRSMTVNVRQGQDT